KDALQELGAFVDLVTRKDPSPWTGVQFTSGASVQSAVDTARRLVYEAMPALSAAFAQLRSTLGFDEPKSFASADELILHLRAVQTLFEVFEAEAFDANLNETLTQLSRGTTVLMRAWLTITDGQYRKEVERAVSLRKGAKAQVPLMNNELQAVAAEAS